MPPQLALTLCSLFVLFLLRYDRKQAPGVSSLVWLPTLWLLSVSTKPLAHWFSQYSEDASGSPLDQRFIIGVICVGMVVLAWRRFDWRNAMRSQPWLVVFVAYMFLSLIWADIPYDCFKRLIRQFAALLMACVVLSEVDPRHAVQSILRKTAYIMIPFSVLLIKYYPSLGVEFGRWTGESMWVGVATQKNGLGRVCIVAVLFLAWTLFRRWRGRDLPIGRYQTYAEVLLLGTALYLLLTPAGKPSATSVIALCAGILTGVSFLLFRRSQAIMKSTTLIAGVVVLLVIGISLPISAKNGTTIASGLSQALGRDTSFTGRADTWSELTDLAMRRPLLGCGFQSYWTQETRELHRMSHAHSAYLELFNELGVIGVLLFAFFIVAYTRNAHDALLLDYDWGLLCITFLVMALVHGLTESSINAPSSQLTGILIFFAASFSAHASRLASEISDSSPLPPTYNPE